MRADHEPYLPGGLGEQCAWPVPRWTPRALALLSPACDIGACLEEAVALGGIGQSHLQDGNHEQGMALLRQALAVDQGIRSPAGRRVHDILDVHGNQGRLAGKGP